MTTFCLLPMSGAYAQVPAQNNLPASADPARLQDRLIAPELREPDTVIPPASMNISAEIPEAEDGFILEGIKIEGMSAFPTDIFNPVIAEYIGRSVDLNTLNHLAARITQRYRDEGYFISKAVVPQQEVVDGNVTIQVIEGHVGVAIMDDPYNLIAKDHLNIVNRTLRRIEALRPLHGPTLERYLLLLNETNGISVQSVLKAPENQSYLPGTVDIVIRVRKKAPLASLSYNNLGSRFIGPHQLSGSYSLGGVINAMDTLSIQATSSLPIKEMQFGALSYQAPLHENGLKLKLGLSYSNSNPGLYLKNLQTEGDSTQFETSLAYPLIRSRKQNLWLGTSFSLQNSATEFFDQELIDDKTRSLSLYAEYDLQDNWGGYNMISASVSKGLDVLGATKTGTENLSRLEGHSDFKLATLKASRQQDLPASWPGSWQVVTSVAGQYSPDPLLSSQEFGYGGVSYGRAYDPSEITGDQGVSSEIELRYMGLSTVPQLEFKSVPFVFYDIGKVWNEDTGSKPESGASAGFGSYFFIGEKVSGSAQLAFPLTRNVDTPVMGGVDGPRLLLNLSVTF